VVGVVWAQLARTTANPPLRVVVVVVVVARTNTVKSKIRAGRPARKPRLAADCEAAGRRVGKWGGSRAVSQQKPAETPAAETPADRLYAEMLQLARQDPNILGLWVGGSRGKDATTEHSDYDCDIVVVDALADEYRARHGGDRQGFNLGVFSLSGFRAHAAIGSDREWDRYNYAHLRATVDKLDGVIQRLIDDKGCLPQATARARLPPTLDAYVNSLYRSLKNHRDGRARASRLDAAESIPFLLTLLFMLDGRLRPYNKYLEWELTHWPLPALPWSTDTFLRLLDTAAAGDPTAQRTIFAGVRGRVSLDPTLREVLTGWGPEALQLMERPPSDPP
jgi:hypothetical protein